MSASFLSKPLRKIASREWTRSGWVLAVLLPLWMMVGFGLAVIVTRILVTVLSYLGVPLAAVDATILQTTLKAVVYLLMLLFVIGIPRLFRKYVSFEELGLSRLLNWADMALAPAGFIVYFVASSLLVYLGSQLIPGFDLGQVQETGFSHVSQYYEYALAFVTLIVIAPIAEEVLFRGFLYGKLRARMPVWVAVLLTSALFGLLHGQWNVGLDVFALSIVLCSLREVTGSIWSGILLHMLKNSIAFFIIFIHPLL
jgi:membrane protease YdiL (CAAX protease family)